MSDKEKNIIDDALRQKLLRMEMDPPADSWEKISKRLDHSSSAYPFRRRLYRVAVAAVLALLIAAGSVFLYNMQKQDVKQVIVESYNKGKEMDPIAPVAAPVESLAESTADDQAAPVRRKKTIIASVMSAAVPTQAMATKIKVEADDRQEVANVEKADESRRVAEVPTKAMKEEQEAAAPQTRAVVKQEDSEASAKPAAVKSKHSRKWRIGMGGGSLSAGMNNSSAFDMNFANTAYSQEGIESDGISSELKDGNYSSSNTLQLNDHINTDPQTDINHHRPISAGISVSRELNDRWSLQTGIVYSFLKSDWECNGYSEGKVEQKLHFIGLPLSLSYRITQWKGIVVYASGGGMMEKNIVGHDYLTYKSEGKNYTKKFSAKMDPLQLSVNAGLGVSYPLWRFLSPYAEVRSSYYFDNGSDIQTIHTEKPFNVDLQFGVRFGF